MTISPQTSERELVADYEARRARHDDRAQRAARVARRLSAARLSIFVAAVLAPLLLWERHAPTGTIVGVVASCLAAFAGLVILHSRHRSTERTERAFARQFARALARIRREWGSLPEPRVEGSLTNHAFADDLDVFGPVSLAKLLGPRGALAGEPVMREWLLAETPPTLDALRARQGAIAELAPEVDWRTGLSVLSESVGGSGAAAESFLAWAERQGAGLPRPLTWTVRALTLSTTALVLIVLAHPALWSLLVPAIAVNVALSAAWARHISAELEAITARTFDWFAASRMFDHLAAKRPTSPLLKEAMHRAEPEHAASLRMLAAIQQSGEVRYSPMGHAALQVLTLWDFHVVSALEAWRRQHGQFMRRRLRALGEIESCASLAALAWENPTWTFPAFSSTSTSVEAVSLAHPLLPPDVRVANDVTVGPRGTFLLVTGSNMAGKSTLLRAIGLNVVLAQLGAPVCAASCTLPRVRVRTVINVRDSIASGVSLFMAEILRIRSVVAAARDEENPLLLYLADEVLHGTNAEDRRVAVRTILLELTALPTIGVLATHLAGLEADATLGPRARAVHFTEQYVDTSAGPSMTFDYRVRPGPATTRNALRLLESVGLKPRDPQS